MTRTDCKNCRERFSELFDTDAAGLAETAAARETREHLDVCADCRAEWASFSRAVSAMRSHEIDATTPRLADQILSAVDSEAHRLSAEPSDDQVRREVFSHAMTGNARETSRLRLVGSHAAVLLLGVAAAAVLLPMLGVNTPEPEIIEHVRTVQVPQPTPFVLELVSGGGRVLRDGRALEIAGDLAFEPRAGDVLEVTPKGFAVPLSNGGSVHITTLPVATPEPRIIERPVEVPVEVERVRIVERGPLVHVDGEAFDHAVGRIEGLVRSVGTQMRDLAEPPAEPITTDEPLDVSVPSAAPLAASEPAPKSPVTVRRIGDRIRIETVGAPYEVIPGLIAYLDGGDDEVSEVARLQLEEIRGTLAADPELAAVLVDPATEKDEGMIATVKGLFTETPAPGPSTESETWQAWWDRNAVHILEAGTWGTF